uniref:uncharacterized protein n=1 Tax=Myxine glutinosa TaxID=7769 RepID=UPI00358F286A
MVEEEEEGNRLCCSSSVWQDHSASPVYDESNKLSELQMKEKVFETMLLDQWKLNDKLMLSQGRLHQCNMQLKDQIAERRLWSMSNEKELKNLQVECQKMKMFGEIDIPSEQKDLHLAKKLLQIPDCKEEIMSRILSALLINPTIMQIIGLLCQVVFQILPMMLGCLTAVFSFFCLSFSSTLGIIVMLMALIALLKLLLTN